MRHHVGGTPKDDFGHGHGTGPALATDLHTSLERYDTRKRLKKAARVRRKLARQAYQKEQASRG